MSLTILFQDDHYVAIDKPAGMLVHRSPISRDRVFVLQRLRDQIGRRVYPVHRLDRATSGVLLFALSADAAKKAGSLFEDDAMTKEYLAVVRGWTDTEGIIEHAIADDEGNGVAQPATTRYRRLATIELPHAVDRYPSARYSLVAVEPVTGRRQQIRKHFKHISHHLIGDTTHGNGRHNRFFRDRLGIDGLLLMAARLGLRHPYTGRSVCITAAPAEHCQRAFALFGYAPGVTPTRTP
ncbi:MAG: pseudouridylate synthase [Gammaproteobacteria bacterium]|nr:pseudouridylate synthase [Gammaproteobacteria bacterium]